MEDIIEQGEIDQIDLLLEGKNNDWVNILHYAVANSTLSVVKHIMSKCDKSLDYTPVLMYTRYVYYREAFAILINSDLKFDNICDLLLIIDRYTFKYVVSRRKINHITTDFIDYLECDEELFKYFLAFKPECEIKYVGGFETIKKLCDDYAINPGETSKKLKKELGICSLSAKIFALLNFIFADFIE